MFQIVQRSPLLKLRLLAMAAAVILVVAACGGSDPASDATEDPDAASSASADEEPEASDTEASDTETTSTVADDPGEPATDEDATAEVATDPSDEETDPASSDDSEPDGATTTTVVEGDAPDEVEDTPALDPEDETVNDTPDSGEAILAGMLPFLGIEDVEATTECIEAEADSENLTLEEVTAGEGDGAMVAIFRCRPEQMRELLSTSFAEIETSSIAATPDQLTCGFDTLLDWFPTIPLAEADVVLADDAPDEILNLIADTCDMSTEDADTFLNAS